VHRAADGRRRLSTLCKVSARRRNVDGRRPDRQGAIIMHRISCGSRTGRWLLGAALACGTPLVSAGAWADEAPQQSEADAVTARAKIQKIDKTARTVTLVDSRGSSLDIQVGQNVDLNSLHVGDMVQATYYESVAVAIRSPNEGPTGATEKMIERPGTTVRQTTVNARVASVDMKTDMVTLGLPNGGTRMVHVKDPSLQARLGQLKPGNMVDITYTQAAALSIQPSR
jgi:hypothetical protein